MDVVGFPCFFGFWGCFGRWLRTATMHFVVRKRGEAMVVCGQDVVGLWWLFLAVSSQLSAWGLGWFARLERGGLGERFVDAEFYRA